jgi:alpha-galactosidase
MGKLGFDIVVSQLGAKDLEFCQNAIKTYNTEKQIIWLGDQYRLSDPVTSSIASVLYLDSAKTSGIIFNYLVNNRYDAGSKLPIRLKGLDPARRYKVTEINLYPDTKSPIDAGKVYTGDFLMKIGFNPELNTRRTSVVLKLEAY